MSDLVREWEWDQISQMLSLDDFEDDSTSEKSNLSMQNIISMFCFVNKHENMIYLKIKSSSAFVFTLALRYHRSVLCFLANILYGERVLS